MTDKETKDAEQKKLDHEKDDKDTQEKELFYDLLAELRI